MINLADPKLAHLVARYRAWVEAQNQRRQAPQKTMPGEDMQSVTLIAPSFLGFMDWLIREGVQPEGVAEVRCMYCDAPVTRETGFAVAHSLTDPLGWGQKEGLCCPECQREKHPLQMPKEDAA